MGAVESWPSAAEQGRAMSELRRANHAQRAWSRGPPQRSKEGHAASGAATPSVRIGAARPDTTHRAWSGGGWRTGRPRGRAGPAPRRHDQRPLLGVGWRRTRPRALGSPRPPTSRWRRDGSHHEHVMQRHRPPVAGSRRSGSARTRSRRRHCCPSTSRVPPGAATRQVAAGAATVSLGLKYTAVARPRRRPRPMRMGVSASASCPVPRPPATRSPPAQRLEATPLPAAASSDLGGQASPRSVPARSAGGATGTRRRHPTPPVRTPRSPPSLLISAPAAQSSSAQAGLEVRVQTRLPL